AASISNRPSARPAGRRLRPHPWPHRPQPEIVQGARSASEPPNGPLPPTFPPPTPRCAAGLCMKIEAYTDSRSLNPNITKKLRFPKRQVRGPAGEVGPPSLARRRSPLRRNRLSFLGPPPARPTSPNFFVRFSPPAGL